MASASPSSVPPLSSCSPPCDAAESLPPTGTTVLSWVPSLFGSRTTVLSEEERGIDIDLDHVDGGTLVRLRSESDFIRIGRYLQMDWSFRALATLVFRLTGLNRHATALTQLRCDSFWEFHEHCDHSQKIRKHIIPAFFTGHTHVKEFLRSIKLGSCTLLVDGELLECDHFIRLYNDCLEAGAIDITEHPVYGNPIRAFILQFCNENLGPVTSNSDAAMSPSFHEQKLPSGHLCRFVHTLAAVNAIGIATDFPSLCSVSVLFAEKMKRDFELRLETVRWATKVAYPTQIGVENSGHQDQQSYPDSISLQPLRRAVTAVEIEIESLFSFDGDENRGGDCDWVAGETEMQQAMHDFMFEPQDANWRTTLNGNDILRQLYQRRPHLFGQWHVEINQFMNTEAMLKKPVREV